MLYEIDYHAMSYADIALELAKKAEESGVAVPFDEQKCRKMLHEHAERAREAIDGRTDEDAIQALNRYVFEGAGFGMTDVSDPRFLLPEVLESKRGNCLGLTAFYLCIGEQLGLPFYEVNAPEHVFVRLESRDGLRRNIETTADGAEWADEKYRQKYRIHPRSIGNYLRNNSKRGFIATVLNFIGSRFHENGNFISAMSCYAQASELDPSFLEAKGNMAMIYRKTGDAQTAMLMFLDILNNDPFNIIAINNLGHIAFDEHRYETALRYYRHSLNRQEESAAINLAVYRCLMALGETDEAQKYIDRAGEICRIRVESAELELTS